MKRLVLLLSLVLLLALAACADTPDNQELLPTDTAATPTSALEAPVEGATGDQQVVASLANTTWEWVETTTPTETITAVDPARYTITFNADGSLAIVADCNSVRGNYVTDETGGLTVTLGASTAVGCPADTQDQVFLAGLAGAARVFMLEGGGDLYIDQIADAGTMRFRAAGASEGDMEAEPTGALGGVTWEWVSLIDPLGQTLSSDPTRYTITFNEDGTANVVADCNSVFAEYQTDGVNIDISPGAGTLVACEPGSQDQLFLNSLIGGAAYTVEDGELFISLEGDAGTLMFRQATAGGEMEEPGTTMPTLTGTTWEWVETVGATESVAAADPTRYTITFNEDGSAAIKGDCNTVLGTYTTAEDGTLTITLGPSTLMACPEDSQAQPFLAGLAAAASYSFDGGDLLIDQAADAGTLRFRAAGAAGEGEPEPEPMALTGTTWQWIETATPVETVAVADPTRYTLTFNEDGTAAIKADCNQVTATYMADSGTLSVVPGASTLALCPEDSQGTAFVTALSSAATYFFQDGFLYIDQFASAGTMKFAAAETAAVEEPGKGEAVAGGEGLVGPVWQLTLITKTDGNITINDPARFTISFNADGTANLQADCNVGGANYTSGDGNTLSITPTVSTMAFCGVGSFDQIFLGGLTNAMGYRLEDGNLLIDMLYESGTMVFMPAS